MNDSSIKLTITRKKRFIGSIIPFTVIVDGINIGLLKNNSTITYNLKKGKHNIIFRTVEKDVCEEIDIKDNVKKVEISTIAKMGLITATIKIESVKYI